MSTVVGGPPPEEPPEKDELADMIRFIVKHADEKKAENITAIRVSTVTTMTSFMVFISATSSPQTQAIATTVMDKMEEEYNLRPGSTGVPEGNAQSGWMLLDYDEVVVNIMTPKSRNFYNIEGFWLGKGAEPMNLSDVIIPPAVEEASTETLEKGRKQRQRRQDVDPFWS